MKKEEVIKAETPKKEKKFTRKIKRLFTHETDFYK